MKLKNIIIAISAIVAFSACSNDDDNKIKFENGEAKLSLKVTTKGVTTDIHEMEGESNINNLSALVFDASDEFLGYNNVGSLGMAGSCQIDDMLVPAGGSKIVFVANAPATVFNNVQTYADFTEVLALLSNQEQANLTMSTQVITFSEPMEEGEQYYVGFGSAQPNLGGVDKLWLTRVPARLQVAGVSTRFTGWMANKRVVIEEVYFQNMKSKSRYFSEADWGAVEVEGSNLYQTSYVYRPKNATASNSSPISDLGIVLYTMENTNLENPTRIAVKATLYDENNNSMATKTFYGVVNAEGKNPVRVKRNYVYNITFSFSDGSFEVEDPIVDLDLVVSVANWGVIKQEVEQ